MSSGWRIVPEGRATDAFSGEGAKRYGGRWNSPGVAVAYASQHKSLAALEQLVHYAPGIPNRFKCFFLEFDDSLLEVWPLTKLPADWRTEPPPPSTMSIGDAWVREARSVVLAVPSIIIPDETNYLLNPAHSDFKRIRIGKPTNFDFDPRLVR